MTILNIAGYKFIQLSALPEWRELLLAESKARHLKGTILLSSEGININVAGKEENTHAFLTFLKSQEPFSDISFKCSYSDFLPFKRLKIKIKKEIITLRHPAISPAEERARAITPLEFKRWLDEGRDMVVLDTRNDFEVQCGTFRKAVHLKLTNFCEFPGAVLASDLPKNKPIVMFCTGGIRCEKAALYLKQADFKEVYQLEGGILGYFNDVGGDHYQGECFVFDERTTVNFRDYHKEN